MHLRFLVMLSIMLHENAVQVKGSLSRLVLLPLVI
jgi:hypothetical protein